MPSLKFPHIFVPKAPTSLGYTNPNTPFTKFQLPFRPDREGHADRTRRALDLAWAAAKKERDKRQGTALPTLSGTYLELEAAPNFDLRLTSLEDRSAGIELLNVREEMNGDGNLVMRATIFVPHGAQTKLIRKIQDYRNPEKDLKSGPKNRKFIESIEEIRRAVLHSFWYDPTKLIPVAEEKVWCEVWLRALKNEQDVVIDEYLDIAQSLGLETKEGHIQFTERVVILTKASKTDLDNLLASFDNIAEFRRAKETATFWTSMQNATQANWVENLSKRLSVENDTNASLCVLDTGVNYGHPLLSPILLEEDSQTVNPEWLPTDNYGHGTAMCGTAAFGDKLPFYLETSASVELPFCIESVKLIDHPGITQDPRLYGLRTQQAFSRAEILKPNKNRVYCLAITSEDGRDVGRPSSWSGALDDAIAGTHDGVRRLCVVSAGNITDPSDWKNYPDPNFVSSAHDPAQSWNALCVGGVTYLDKVQNKELVGKYKPLASAGQLSPYSTTSRSWDKYWPNKPDIVMEAGNLCVDKNGFTSQDDDLSLLTTSHDLQNSLLGSNFATSAAAGLASEICAQLRAGYPDAWPETIRGLVVHSARWSDELKDQLIRDHTTETEKVTTLLRMVGYGVPSLRRALESADNSLTLIAEQEFQPFIKNKKNTGFTANDMHLYELLWPVDALEALPDKTLITIDVTLSYFVEPGPGEKGWRDKYLYRSHGLDFNINKPIETLKEFALRVNKEGRENNQNAGGSSVPWYISPMKGRTRGSIHRDWVEMTAEEAKACRFLGIFPRTGWWKERHHLGRAESKTRYSLIVSVRTSDETLSLPIGVSLYNSVANQVDIITETEIIT